TSELPRGLRRGRAAADSASSPAASSPAARAASSPARPAADRGAAAVAPGSTEPDQEVIDASDGLRRDSSTRPPTMPISINGAAGPEPDGGACAGDVCCDGFPEDCWLAAGACDAAGALAPAGTTG